MPVGQVEEGNLDLSGPSRPVETVHFDLELLVVTWHGF